MNENFPLPPNTEPNAELITSYEVPSPHRPGTRALKLMGAASLGALTLTAVVLASGLPAGANEPGPEPLPAMELSNRSFAELLAETPIVDDIPGISSLFDGEKEMVGDNWDDCPGCGMG